MSMDIIVNYGFFFISGFFFAWVFLRLLEKRKRFLEYLTKFLFFLVIGYCLFLIYRVLNRFYNFSSEVIDLSYYHSVVWQLSEFKIPHLWDIPSRFVWGDHFEPILLFLVPFYWFGKNAFILMLVQVLMVILGAIPLYLLVRDKFKDKLLALSFVFAYLLFLGLQMGYAYGFHPILFAPPLLFWTYYFLEKEKKITYFLFLLLSLMIKEEISLIAVFLGIYIFLFKRKHWMGFLTILISLLWSYLCFQIIFPYFNQGTGFLHFGQYGEIGKNGFLGMVQYLLTNPKLFFQTLISPPDKIETFFHTYGAFAFLPLFYPPAFFLTLPSLLEKLLSSNIARLNGFHYSAAIWASVTIASFESLSFLLKKAPVDFLRKTHFWAILIIYVAVAANIVYGYEPLKPFYKEKTLSSTHINLLYGVINDLPAEASVSAQYQIVPHINRPFGKILPVPRNSENSDYVLVDLRMPLVLSSKEDYLNYLKNLLDNKNYELILNEDKILIFRKISQ